MSVDMAVIDKDNLVHLSGSASTGIIRRLFEQSSCTCVVGNELQLANRK
jgi:hypothetical protein